MNVPCPSCNGLGSYSTNWLGRRVVADCQNCKGKGEVPAPVPRRIQLRRTAGFVLQTTSRAMNGLNAIKVDRTTRWGNPFTATNGDNATAVATFKATLETWSPDKLEEYLAPLRGKNLACWCHLSAPCHRSVLLELANS